MVEHGVSALIISPAYGDEGAVFERIGRAGLPALQVLTKPEKLSQLGHEFFSIHRGFPLCRVQRGQSEIGIVGERGAQDGAHLAARRILQNRRNEPVFLRVDRLGRLGRPFDKPPDAVLSGFHPRYPASGGRLPALRRCKIDRVVVVNRKLVGIRQGERHRNDGFGIIDGERTASVFRLQPAKGRKVYPLRPRFAGHDRDRSRRADGGMICDGHGIPTATPVFSLMPPPLIEVFLF